MAKPTKSSEVAGSRHKDRHMVSLPAALYERLKALAKRNDRPVAWEARRILEEGIAAAESRK